MEVALYKEWGSEVAESRLETGAPRFGWRLLGARLCLEGACTRGSCWRMGEERRVEEVKLKLVRGASGSPGPRPTNDADTFGAKCRRVWRPGGCRWGSEEAGRMGSG